MQRGKLQADERPAERLQDGLYPAKEVTQGSHKQGWGGVDLCLCSPSQLPSQRKPARRPTCSTQGQGHLSRVKMSKRKPQIGLRLLLPLNEVHYQRL